MTSLTTPPLIPTCSAYIRRCYGSVLIRVMACRLFGVKPLPEPMLVYRQLDSFQWTSIRNSIVFIQEMHLKMSSSKMVAILSKGRWVNVSIVYRSYFTCEYIDNNKKSPCVLSSWHICIFYWWYNACYMAPLQVIIPFQYFQLQITCHWLRLINKLPVIMLNSNTQISCFYTLCKHNSHQFLLSKVVIFSIY